MGSEYGAGCVGLAAAGRGCIGGFSRARVCIVGDLPWGLENTAAYLREGRAGPCHLGRDRILRYVEPG